MTYPKLLNASTAGVILTLAVLGAIAFYFFQSPPAVSSSQSSSSSSTAGPPGASVAVHRQTRGQAVPSQAIQRPQASAGISASHSIYSEIRDSKNLRATMDRLRALPDPTGEISFQLAKAIADCGDYDGTKPQQARENAATVKDPVRRQLQERMLAHMVARCIGFDSPMERYELLEELQNKASQARHPAEQARRLHRDFVWNRDVASGDAATFALLDKAPFPDVIKGISAYIGYRNNGPTLSPDDVFKPGEYRKYDINVAAWTLLECDLGLDCGSQHRMLQYGCAHLSQCGSENVNEHVRDQLLSPAEYATALAVKQRLLAALQAKDWARFGLYPLPQKSRK